MDQAICCLLLQKPLLVWTLGGEVATINKELINPTGNLHEEGQHGTDASSQKQLGICGSQEKPTLVSGALGPKTWEVMQFVAHLRTPSQENKPKWETELSIKLPVQSDFLSPSKNVTHMKNTIFFHS